MSTKLNSLSLQIRDSYKQIAALKKAPEKVAAKNPHDMRETISRSLLTVRQNIQKFEDLDIRLARVASTKVVKPWRGAIRDALKKLHLYKGDLTTAQRRWSTVTPDPKKFVSIYPLSKTRITLFDALSDLYAAIKERFGNNVKLPYRKFRNGNAAGGSIGEVPIPPLNASLSSREAFGNVERAWKLYLLKRRSADARVRSPSRLGDEVSILRINLAQFKGIRNRSVYISKGDVPYIRKVLTMYQTYIGHVEKAYKDSVKQKPSVNPPEGPQFAALVVAFFLHLGIPIDSPGYVRRATTTAVSRHTANNHIPVGPVLEELAASKSEHVATRAERNRLKNRLSLETAARKRGDVLYLESLDFLRDLIYDYNVDLTRYGQHAQIIFDLADTFEGL